MRRSIRILLGAATLLAAGLSGGRVQANDGDPARERQRIEAERAVAAARFSEQQRICEGRFAVTTCVDEAKRQRRETLARLRREQNALDDRERHGRAAERLEEIRKRREEQAARDAELRPARSPVVAPRASSSRARAAAQPASMAASRARPVPSAEHRLPHLGRIGSERSPAEEARSRAAFDAAQREAAAHRAEVEARNARRAAEHKPAAPLPVPPGASAP
jgi:colicin import membrane protein